MKWAPHVCPRGGGGVLASLQRFPPGHDSPVPVLTLRITGGGLPLCHPPFCSGAARPVPPAARFVAMRWRRHRGTPEDPTAAGGARHRGCLSLRGRQSAWRGPQGDPGRRPSPARRRLRMAPVRRYGLAAKVCGWAGALVGRGPRMSASVGFVSARSMPFPRARENDVYLVNTLAGGCMMVCRLESGLMLECRRPPPSPPDPPPRACVRAALHLPLVGSTVVLGPESNAGRPEAPAHPIPPRPPPPHPLRLQWQPPPSGMPVRSTPTASVPPPGPPTVSQPPAQLLKPLSRNQ